MKEGTVGDGYVYGVQRLASLSELKIAHNEDAEDVRGGLCNA